MGKIKDWWNDHKERIGEFAYAATVGLTITVGGLLLGGILYGAGQAAGYQKGMDEWATRDWDSYNGYMCNLFDKDMNDYKQSLTDAEKEES